MLDIRKKKVKAIYFNAFHCPECSLELHMDNIVLTTYPAEYCYYCDCGFRTTSSQKPGLEYEFEDEKELSINSAIHVSRQCEIPEKFCPTCGEKLDGEVMKVYNHTCFLYDCPNGCKLKSSEAYVYTDENVITYKVEEEDLPPAYPERIKELFLNPEPISDDALFEFNNLGLRQDIDADAIKRISTAINNSTVSTSQAIANLIALGEGFADKTGGVYCV